jgi:uncharacterized protein (TIGR00369 family)
MPFNRLLGIKIKRRHRDGVTVEIPLRGDLMNFHGVLHGGVTASLADVAVGIALHNHFQGKSRATTVEMKLNYFLPVTGKKLTARSRLVKVGKTLCVGRVDLLNDARKLVAAAIVTYMLLPAEEKSGSRGKLNR